MSSQPSGDLCPVTEINPSGLPPSQQLALLTLDRGLLARAVVAKLRSSTVRASSADYRALIELGLAERTVSGVYHRATAMGAYLASRLARELAQKFNVRPLFTGPRRRGLFVPGGFSQAGNW